MNNGIVMKFDEYASCGIARKIQGISNTLAYLPLRIQMKLSLRDTCSRRCDLIGDVLCWGNIALDVAASEHSRAPCCCMPQAARSMLHATHAVAGLTAVCQYTRLPRLVSIDGIGDGAWHDCCCCCCCLPRRVVAQFVI